MGVRGRSLDETTETSSRIREALADAHEEWAVEVEEVSGQMVIEAEREQFHPNGSSAGALALDHPKKAGWEVRTGQSGCPMDRDVRHRRGSSRRARRDHEHLRSAAVNQLRPALGLDRPDVLHYRTTSAGRAERRYRRKPSVRRPSRASSKVSKCLPLHPDQSVRRTCSWRWSLRDASSRAYSVR